MISLADVTHVVVDSVPPSGFDLRTLSGTIVGFMLGLFAAPLKAYFFRPKVTASFTANDHCIRQTPVATKDGIVAGVKQWVVRFEVKNGSRFLAKACRVYLDRVERVSTNEVELLLADRVALKWAYIGYDPQDIPGTTGIYCDLVSTFDSGSPLTLHTDTFPVILIEAFKKPGIYRFRCFVAGDNFKPQIIQVMVDWKGQTPLNDVWQESTD